MNETAEDRAASNATVTVRGVGTARVRADGVGIALTVRHRAESADGALQEAARKEQALEELFVELGIDEERWVTAGVSLEQWTEWEEETRREAHRGYVASTRLVVTLPDISMVGRLLAEAAARAEATVQGPWWDIAADNPAHDVARRQAMTDARRRAETYAEAAGMALGALLEVVEVGAENPRRFMRLPASMAARALSGGPEMPARGEGLLVFAAVDVTYLLASP